jgi:Protein of Unknown function (DUF2784)
MKPLYFVLNPLFHVVHIAIISFVLLGWLIPEARFAHLVLSLLTLGSWFVLGRWMGEGYCPISDWHWKIKGSLGEGRPAVTYITFLLRKVTGIHLNSDRVNQIVVYITVAITMISLTLNVQELPCYGC